MKNAGVPFFTIILYLTQQHFKAFGKDLQLYIQNQHIMKYICIGHTLLSCHQVSGTCMLLSIMKRIGPMDKGAFCAVGAVCTSAYVIVLLSSPSQVPERCSWCGYGAVEQGSQWQFQVEESINSLPLSQSISSFLVSEGFLLQKKGVKLCISIYPFIFHAVEDYK